MTDQRAEIDVVEAVMRVLHLEDGFDDASFERLLVSEKQHHETNGSVTGLRIIARQIVEALRPFRIAAEAKASGEAMERAAKIALAQIAEPGLSDNPAYVRFNPADLMAKRIAAAIRAEAG